MSSQYQKVTDRIVEMLERGTRPWVQSWASGAGGGNPLRHDGQRYRGVNVINLWAAGMSRGFTSNYWLTYKKAQELGAQVRKGAKSEVAFYVGRGTRESDDGTERGFTFLKCYPVFSACEIEGLAPHYYQRTERPALDPACRVAATDEWTAATGATIHHGGGRAFYRPSNDEIHMPDFGAFDNAPAYYGTLLHELTHWTGAAKRLDRGKGNLFGTPEYAFEELIAELGASYLTADLAIETTPREDHASYIASWLTCLRSDPRAIFRAASFAEKAAEYLHQQVAPMAEAAD